MLESRCRYKEHGCRTKVEEYDLENHEKECQYRLVQCVDVIIGCRNEIPLIGGFPFEIEFQISLLLTLKKWILYFL